MTKQLQKTILKHLESEVSRLSVAVFNEYLDNHPNKKTKSIISITRKLKHSEKNLVEFKKMYLIK